MWRGGGGGTRSDRKNLVLEFWEAQNLNSQVFFERTWFWRFGRLKISILRAFCHSYVGLGAVTEFSWGGGGRPQ